MLQGRFGALENMGEVYDFVFENMFDKQREFYLYDTPPKWDLVDRSQKLHTLGLVPQGKLMFSWKDETLKSESDYVLDIKTLRDKIK